MVEKMKEITISFKKFNKKVKPYRCYCKDKRGPSVVYYKDATDYIFDLNRRIINASDLRNQIDLDK